MMAGGTKQSFPRWWQGLIILVSGIVIGFSSCVGFLNGLNYGGGRSNSQAASNFFAIGFFAGIAVALVGFVLMIIGIARATVNALRPPPAPALFPQPGTREFATGAPRVADDPEQRVLRQFQIVLVVFMLLPAASIATSVLVLLNRPNAWRTLVLFVVSYVFSQAPYGLALARTRRGLDRLGIAIAFAASCVLVVEGFLPLVHVSAMFAARQGLFGWPSLLLIGHAVVAVYAWRAGQLAPPEGDDMAMIVGSFVGIVAYMVIVRFLETSFLPLFLR
jgi:hypothetical protein